MSRHEHSVVIARPLDHVFGYMSDVGREPEWQPRLVEAEQTPPGPPAIGSRRRYVSEFLGKRVVNTYVVTDYEPKRRLVCESTRDSVVRATSEIRWQETGDGTRVTMTFDGTASGPLRFVPKPLLEATFDREVHTALRRLKERLEAGV